jgi:penicillin-binding protein 2
MGEDGTKVVVVNSVGREIGAPPDGEPPKEGQAASAHDRLRRAAGGGGRLRGVGLQWRRVVLDPRNGEVLAFTSRPAYDPKAFAGGIDRATWAKLNTDDLHPLQNRALQGRYSPGSTFKMAVGLAGLEEGIISPNFTVHCGGGANFYGRFFKCWQKGGHGRSTCATPSSSRATCTSTRSATCSGVDKINKWATLFGLGVRSGIDLPNEVQGLVPLDGVEGGEHEEKKWYAGETISVAIGQGQVSVTPISLAVLHRDARQRRARASRLTS